VTLIGIHDMHEFGANRVAVGLFDCRSYFRKRCIGLSDVQTTHLKHGI